MATRLTPPRPRANKPNRALAVTMGVVGALLFLVPLLTGFYTDWLWFGELDFRGVFGKVIPCRSASPERGRTCPS